MTEATQTKSMLSAIRSDNLSLFRSLWNEKSKKYCFGRFPILSLLYLYGANKILFRYEKELFSVTEYTFSEEAREDYTAFRKIAGRALRLYAGGRTVVLPCEMLALLGQHAYLTEVYPKLPENERGRARICYIEKTLHRAETTFSGTKITVRKKKIPFSQMKEWCVATLIAVLFLTLSALGCVYAQNNQAGTQENPFVLQTGVQAQKALTEGGYYALESDLTLDGSDEWKGHLNGRGHTVTLNGNIKNFSGTASDLKIVCNGFSIETLSDKGTLQNVQIECNQTAIGENKGTLDGVSFSSTLQTVAPTADYSFFIGKNSGYMKDITANAVAEITFTEEHENIYINLFGSENTGTIENGNVTVRWKIKNSVANDTFASCFFGKNLGKIVECKVQNDSYIETDTVDVGVICIQNGSLDKQDAEITSCSVEGTFSQTSREEGWSPNVGGIAVQNFGKIDSCSVQADLQAENTFVKTEEKEDDYVGSTFSGGICVLNGGTVSQCSFQGNLKADSSSQYVYIGGIVCRSVIIEETEKDGYTYLLGNVEKSTAKGTARTSQAKESYIGGIVAHNFGRYETGESYGYFSQTSYTYGIVSACETDMEITCGANGYIGGAIAINYGQATDCKVKLTATAGDGSLVGGLTAYGVVNESSSSFFFSSESFQSMNKSEVEMTATAGNDCLVGGIAAFCNSSSYVTAYMENCRATSTVTMGEKGYFGGLAGKSGTYIQYSQSEGSLQAGKTATAGGIVGYNGGTVGYCESNFSLSVGDTSYVGGIVGQNKGSVAYTKVYGKLNAGKSCFAGGNAGKNEYNLKNNFVLVEEYSVGEDSYAGYQAGDTLLSYSYSYGSGIVYNVSGNCHVVAEGVENAYGNLSNYTPSGETEEEKEKDLREMTNFQETEFATEKEMKNSSEYKEVFDDEEESAETEQGKTAVSFIVR